MGDLDDFESQSVFIFREAFRKVEDQEAEDAFERLRAGGYM
jgi:hypothetical protein